MDMRAWQEQQKKKSGISDHEEQQQVKVHNGQQQTDNRGDQQKKHQGERHQSQLTGQPTSILSTNNGNRGNRMPEQFHNPYHFVPIPKSGRKGDCSKTDFIAGTTPHLTHDRYLTEDHFSGRIICRLETLSPIFIGGRHKEGEREIPPFELETGIPAIPASSLRGLISSLAETASNSALRVLEDEDYSRRVGMSESLKAMGMLEKDKGTGKLMLRPLMMPSIKCDSNGDNAKLDPEYAAIFTKPALRVYLDKYRTKPRSNPPEQERDPGSFIARNLDSYSADKKEFWYMQLGTPFNPRVKTIHGRNGDTYWLNGQLPVTGIPIDQETFDTLEAKEQKAFTPGIIRVLGLGVDDDRSKDMPGTKKHEIFIPYDPQSPVGVLLEVADALKEFEKLAQSRIDLKTIPETPFELKGSKCKASGAIKLQEGDLVFFSVDGNSKVTELAISSIWRRWIDGTSHQFFSGISPESKELLPMNAKREKITIAEQMFGFVSESEKDSGDESLAFKSRIRFSNGLNYEKTEQGYYLDEEVTLKILASPKPPSSSLYFIRQNGKYIPKEIKDPRKDYVLSLSKSDLPQGRKMYLHHRDAKTRKPWETAPGLVNTDAKQKSKITPIRDGLSFYFHIDFNNLNQNELLLLCYAIAPDSGFMHKIGMGKPIGLGSVKIHPEGLFIVDRKERYSVEGFCGNRYHQAWKSEDVKWPSDRYASELASSDSKQMESVATLAKKNPVQPDIKKAIELLGAIPSKDVHYPQVQGGNTEDKLFQWFVANDKGSGSNRNGNQIRAAEERLKPITKDSEGLPLLTRHPWNG